MAKRKSSKGGKKRKLSPGLKAYNACVKEFRLNPRKVNKKTKEGRANIQRLKACAAKKLRRSK